jgi:AraC-like DNA-binding protein
MVIDRAAFRRLCRARALLSHVDGEAPTIEAVARAVSISPSHFIRLFEALFGLTPHQYRMRARLLRAQALLASGERTVTEVCFEVGCASLGSFSELFRQRVGVSPSLYQRRAQVQVPRAGLVPGVPGCLGLMTRLPADAFRGFREA